MRVPIHHRGTTLHSRGDFGLTLQFTHFRDMAVLARSQGLVELQTGFAVQAMGSMGNRGMNLRDGQLPYVFLHDYPSLRQNHGKTGVVFRNYNGHKGHEDDVLYSACVPAVKCQCSNRDPA